MYIYSGIKYLSKIYLIIITILNLCIGTGIHTGTYSNNRYIIHNKMVIIIKNVGIDFIKLYNRNKILDTRY